MSASRKAVILDRDGVINFDRPDYVKSTSEFVPIPGSLQAIGRLTESGFRVFVATNQANIGRGTLSWTTLNDMHAGLRRALLPLGGCIDEIYVCPHRPEESCGCRKPRPGMLLRAASDHGLDLSRVWFIGDTASDMAAAEAAGAVGVRLRNDPDPPGLTNLSFTDLAAAVDALIASWQRGGVTG